MRSLACYLKEYKKESILAPFFKFLEVVFDLIVPLVIAQIIDVGVAQNDHGYIVQRFFILILMAAAGLTCSFTAQYFAAKASVGFAANLRQAVFDHIQRLSFTELDTLGTDTLITRLTDDVNQVQNGVNMGLRLLLRSPIYRSRLYGHGFHHQRPLCIDLRDRDPHSLPGGLRYHVRQHPAL